MKLLEDPFDSVMTPHAHIDPQPTTAAHFLIVDLGNPVARDVSEAIAADAETSVQYVAPGSELPCNVADSASVIVFTRSATQRLNSLEVSRVAKRLPVAPGTQVCFVTGCSAHFEAPGRRGDFRSFGAEFRDSVPGVHRNLRLLRTSFVLSPRSRVSQWCRRLAWLSPLLADSPRAGFVTLEELTECLRTQTVVGDETPESAEITLLGANRSWKDVLAAYHSSSIFSNALLVIAACLKFLGAGILLRAALRLVKRLRPALRRFDFDTIRPQSEAELLSLCHQHNFRHVEVCGYNNGVNHFGWKHDGRTIVPTTDTGATIEIEDDHVLVDAGVTLNRCIQTLADAGRQFYVVPNYSYIGMGTVFFVPVHGSGSDVSTLGDTIEWVRLFNPETGEFLEAARGEPLFQNTMYNRRSGLILLQLIFRVREATQYFVQKTEQTAPTAEQVWNVFFDQETSNIEIRKNRAASDEIQIAKYYTGNSDAADRLSVPRDTIGSLWDRLEENRVTAYLFHLLVRKLAYHVELFLREDEFAIFWEHHQRLPVSKIQLRLAKRDGMPHSPFGDADCVSADLFMSRRRRDEFQEFVRSHLPNVRLNPGKQSM